MSLLARLTWRGAQRVAALRWAVLPPVAGVAMFVLLAGAVIAAPREAVEGEVQRIFYIHVPSALAAYLGVGVACLASVALLWRRDMRWDAIARAGAMTGVLFTGLTLATGMIWGKPIWGVWWTWDARLTSTLILFLLYSAYLLARQLADETDEQAARFAAVFAIVAFVDIPIINLSVRWWRTLHPQPIVFDPFGEQALPGSMMLVLAIGILAVGALALWLIVLRAEAEGLAQRTAVVRHLVDRREAR
ncbi:MAG: cytochrome c biogenesis protein CcsA [Chloroflexi bacterium]|nr:cytochrome c biogenesis protein CcsA [Chloroflexota bacterium]